MYSHFVDNFTRIDKRGKDLIIELQFEVWLFDFNGAYTVWVITF